MVKTKFVAILLVLMFVTGCEEIALFGAGAAGQETLHVWKSNLEQQRDELEQRYVQLKHELDNAPDPNALALARQKIESWSKQSVGNAVALHTVTEMIKYQQTQNPESRKDMIVTGVLGLIALAIRERSRLTLSKKYSAHKAGQAKFEKENPEPAMVLYGDIGYERTIRGL
jgi:hypothetical protein